MVRTAHALDSRTDSNTGVSGNNCVTVANKYVTQKRNAKKKLFFDYYGCRSLNITSDGTRRDDTTIFYKYNIPRRRGRRTNTRGDVRRRWSPVVYCRGDRCCTGRLTGVRLSRTPRSPTVPRRTLALPAGRHAKPNGIVGVLKTEPRWALIFKQFLRTCYTQR